MSHLAVAKWISRSVIRPLSSNSTSRSLSSMGQPSLSTLTFVGVLGQRSRSSGTPSLSASCTRGHPRASTATPLGRVGALVDAVRHAVVVAVLGATALVHHGAHRRVGT